jgi:hypothetical protein
MVSSSCYADAPGLGTDRMPDCLGVVDVCPCGTPYRLRSRNRQKSTLSPLQPVLQQK